MDKQWGIELQNRTGKGQQEYRVQPAYRRPTWNMSSLHCTRRAVRLERAPACRHRPPRRYVIALAQVISGPWEKGSELRWDAHTCTESVRLLHTVSGYLEISAGHEDPC
jgi:hypothetical protein